MRLRVKRAGASLVPGRAAHLGPFEELPRVVAGRVGCHRLDDRGEPWRARLHPHALIGQPPVAAAPAVRAQRLTAHAQRRQRHALPRRRRLLGPPLRRREELQPRVAHFARHPAAARSDAVGGEVALQ